MDNLTRVQPVNNLWLSNQCQQILNYWMQCPIMSQENTHSSLIYCTIMAVREHVLSYQASHQAATRC